MSHKPSGFRASERLIISALTVLLIGFLLVWGRFVPVLNRLFGTNDLDKLAKYGEAYIVLHSLFDMFAWVSVTAAFVLQLRDSRARQEEFRSQFEHQLGESAARYQEHIAQLTAQQKQLEAHLTQVQRQGMRFEADVHLRQSQFEVQRLQSVYFPFLTLFQRYADDVHCGRHRGDDAFAQWAERLDRSGSAHDLPSEYRFGLDYYHRRLAGLLACIRSSKLDTDSTKDTDRKNDYLKMLEAQLSEQQLAVVRRSRRHGLAKDFHELVDRMQLDRLYVAFLKEEPRKSDQ